MGPMKTNTKRTKLAETVFAQSYFFVFDPNNQAHIERHNRIRMKIEEKCDQRFKVSPRKLEILSTYSSACYILHNYKMFLLCVLCVAKWTI